MFRLSGLSIDGVVRDAEVATTGFADSQVRGTLCAAANKLYLRQAAKNPNIKAVVVDESLLPMAPPELGVIVSESPLQTFYDIHNLLVSEQLIGQLAETSVAPDAKIHASAVIGRNCRISSDVEIMSNAVVDNCILDSGVTIGEGALIGVAGYFSKDFGDRRVIVEHAGIADIKKGVQILAGAIVQRGVFSEATTIGAESVIGPGVKVSHGVRLGCKTSIAGGVILAGFSTVGDNVWIGPGSVIGNRLTIGDGARVEIGSVVVQSIPAGQRRSGSFAIDHLKNLRLHSRLWKK